MQVGSERDRFVSMLRDSILMLCRSGLFGGSCIASVEGLLGITLHDQQVFLISIKEMLHDASPKSIDCVTPLTDGDVSETREVVVRTMQNTGSTERSPELLTKNVESEMRTESLETSIKERSVPLLDFADSQRINTSSPIPFSVQKNLPDKNRGIKRTWLAESRQGDDGTDSTGIVSSQLRSISCTSEPTHSRTSDSVDCDSAEIAQKIKSEPSDISVSSTESLAVAGNSTSKMDEVFGHEMSFDEYLSSSAAQLASGQPLYFPLPQLPSQFNLDALMHSASGSSVQHLQTFSDIGHSNVSRSYRHGSQRRHDKRKRYDCTLCSYVSDRSYNLLRHIIHIHSTGTVNCPECGINVSDKVELRLHWLQRHSRNIATGQTRSACSSLFGHAADGDEWLTSSNDELVTIGIKEDCH